MRPRLLRAFGWQVESVLAKDWYENRAAGTRSDLKGAGIERRFHNVQ